MPIFNSINVKSGFYLLMLKPIFVTFIYPAVFLVEKFKELYSSTEDVLQFFINIYGEENAGTKIKLILDACKNMQIFTKAFDKETDAEQLSYIISQLKTTSNALKDGFYLQLATQIFLITADTELKKLFPSLKNREANQLVQQGYVLYKSGYFA